MPEEASGKENGMAPHLPTTEKFLAALRKIDRKDVEFAARASSPKGRYKVIDIEIGESNADNPCETVRLFALLVGLATEAEMLFEEGEGDRGREALAEAGICQSFCESIIRARARENGVLIPKERTVGIAYVDNRFRAIHFAVGPEEVEEEGPTIIFTPEEPQKRTIH